MKQIKLGSWQIEVDVAKTKEFYDQYHMITEDCNCDNCANYVLACDTFPEELNKLFHSLGIDPRKEGELSHFIENPDGTHLYVAFYHIIGSIIEEPKSWTSNLDRMEESSLIFEEYNGVDISFTNDLALVPEGFPSPTIQFEIQLNVPWLLK